MTAGELRVLLVDDSPTVRAVLQRILRKAPDLKVVGEADDGEAGVRLAGELEPDVILMDIAMPGLDGFGATTEIMDRSPTAIIVFSTAVSFDGHRVFEALSCGACDVMAKPGSPDGWSELYESLPDRIREIALGFKNGALVERALEGLLPPAEPKTEVPMRPISYIAVGASTGGPEALHELLLGFAPKAPPVPMLIVQHITPEFEDGLADWLRNDLGLDVRMAKHQEVPQAGAIRLAPQGSHLHLGTGGWLHLDRKTPAQRGHRPSVDELFRSCALACGQRVAGILLSGMGRDGVEGLLTLKGAGALTLAQDQATSKVFGMPRAAIQAEAAEWVLPPAQMARLLLKICGEDKG